MIDARKRLPQMQTEHSKMLLITQPDVPGFPALPSTIAEQNQISQAVPPRAFIQQNGEEWGLSRILDACPQASILHLACHGQQNSSDALESGFILKDGRLTISSLIKLNLPDAFFAFLSACESAKGDAQQPDEVISLSAAMIFVGFKSVIGTMW
jgi:CHAT domain-containing protein